jgi:hypothetical protein
MYAASKFLLRYTLLVPELIFKGFEIAVKAV